MGTRSLTVIIEADGNEISVLYRQYDGYLTGHGTELKRFLNGFSVVNGLGIDDRRNTANGMGCLAAQIVARSWRRREQDPVNDFLDGQILSSEIIGAD